MRSLNIPDICALVQYTPTYTFVSARGGFTLTLPDDYAVRNTVLTELHQYAKIWLKAGITRAPFEMQGLLQVLQLLPNPIVQC